MILMARVTWPWGDFSYLSLEEYCSLGTDVLLGTKVRVIRVLEVGV